MIFSGKNFQSWEQFSLDIQGLTIITGPSDIGKSALFRALRGVFYNTVSEAQIREGADKLELSVDLGDNNIITVERKRGESAKYVIAGKPFAKLAGRRPDELKAFGINDIIIGDTRLDPIFASQNDSQFMLQGIGPSELNNILGGFASTEKLEQGKREANLRVTQANGEARTLAVEIHDAEVRKATAEERYEKIVPILARVAVLEGEIRYAQEKTTETDNAWMVKRHHEDLSSRIQGLVIPKHEDLDEQLLKSVSAALAVQTRIEQDKHTSQLVAIAGTVLAYKDVKSILQIVTELDQVLESKRKVPFIQMIYGMEYKFDVVLPLLESIRVMDQVKASRDSAAGLTQEFKLIENTAEIVAVELKQLQAEIDAAEVTTCPKCGERF